MKNLKPIYWIAGLVISAVVVSILSRVLGAALSGPPMLFAMVFAFIAFVAVLVLAIIKKFPKRWLKVAATLLTGVVTFIMLAYGLVEKSTMRVISLQTISCTTRVVL